MARIVDIYDFDVGSTKSVFPGMFFQEGNGILSDKDLAFMHLKGYMRAFRVKGGAKLVKSDVGCGAATKSLLSVNEIVELLTELDVDFED